MSVFSLFPNENNKIRTILPIFCDIIKISLLVEALQFFKKKMYKMLPKSGSENIWSVFEWKHYFAVKIILVYQNVKIIGNIYQNTNKQIKHTN